jgi:hypothetical protein
MKRGLLPTGNECFIFGDENKLKIFPTNSFNFKPKNHIRIDDIQRCILDNFWNQYVNKREDKGYMLSILNSLAEYFNTMNKDLPKSSKIEVPKKYEVQKDEALYILFDGNKPGIYMTWEDVMIEKIDARKKGEDVTFKKYDNINEALMWARKIIGENYYIDPKAKEYIEKKRTNTPTPTAAKAESSGSKNIKDEGSPKYHTYKECLLKGIDPLDSEYIDQELDKRFEEYSKILKKELKEEILNEIRMEMDTKFEEIKKECDSKFDFNISEADQMDIAGHGQLPE